MKIDKLIEGRVYKVYMKSTGVYSGRVVYISSEIVDDNLSPDIQYIFSSLLKGPNIILEPYELNLFIFIYDLFENVKRRLKLNSLDTETKVTV